MGALLSNLTDISTLLAILAAVGVFATIITVAMPVLQKSELDGRMKSVAIERDKIRARERARLADEQKRGSLKHADGGFMQDVSDKLNLKKALADENTFLNLIQAGYRQQKHINVFLFFRFVLPLFLLIGALIYVFGIGNLEHPFMIKVLIAMLVAAAGFYAPNMFIKNKISKRQLSMRRAWPDALDLMLILKAIYFQKSVL